MPQRFSDGGEISIDIEQVFNERPPQFTLTCEDGANPMVLFTLVESPRTPPPLRGEIGECEMEIELS